LSFTFIQYLVVHGRRHHFKGSGVAEGFFRQYKRNARMDDNANVEFYHLKNVSDLVVKLFNKQ